MPKNASIMTLANYLAVGYWRDTGQSLHKFDPNRVSVDLTGLNKAGKELAREALEAWEAVADIRFVEKRSGADVTFSDRGKDADTSVRYSGNEILSAKVEIGASWIKDYGIEVGSYSFQTYLHEIGHALGLGHPGDYNGNTSYNTARYKSDSWQATVMSYIDQAENPTVDASKAYVITPMAADILAIQKLYGKAHNGPTDGKTTFGADLKPGSAMTIYDEGGKDTIDLGHDNREQDVSLLAGSYSDVFGLMGNLGIAKGTVIENYVAGTNDDRVVGNKVSNKIVLGRGDDSAAGKDGNDKLNGEEGNDSLNGGEGNDTLIGGGGKDSFVFTAGQDSVLDFENGRDTVVLDRDLWGGRSLTAEEVLDFAHVEGGDIVFDFTGPGNTLRVENMTDIAALANDLFFV